MNQNNNVSTGRSNGNGSPEADKTRKQIAPWLAAQTRQQEFIRIYGAQGVQLANDAYSNHSPATRPQPTGNFGGGHFLYPSNTAPSVYSPGATQSQVSSEGVYPHHMLSGTHALQQTALAAASLRGYNQNTPILNTAVSPNLQSLAAPFLNMRNRLQSRGLTTTTTTNRFPSSYNPHHQHHRPMSHSGTHVGIQEHVLGRRPYSTSSSPPPAHSIRSAAIASPVTESPTKSSQVRYPDHFRHGSIIKLASGTLKRVEQLNTQDFLDSGNISDDLCIDNSTVVKMDNYTTETAQLGFSVGSDHIMVSVEATLEHPFFVFGRGWSSCSPSKTLSRYNLVCHQLEVGDICISLTHKEQIIQDKLSNNSNISSNTDKPVKVCESSPPLSPNLSSPSITATKSPSPNADISKSNKVDSDLNVDSPVLEKRPKTSE